ncbi:MAG: type I-A CRISPR-associated protein Cas4/Csa1 [Chloroflexi bacterium]|nr:type I-A CRISPR-associated protein Cas4/Csa1 [Chloroflexota bacterium]
MYFLSDEERRYLTGRLLPLARRHPVHPELRGWSWREAPLLSPYDVRLSVYEVAAKYCSTSRDVYLRRVMGVKPASSQAMREGAALHKQLLDVVVEAKRAVYAVGAEECLAALEALATQKSPVDDAGADAGLAPRLALVRNFEYHRIVGRVQDILARHPRVGSDSLVALALPITLEQQLDGTFLGLSSQLSTDALMAFQPIVFDVKFGRRRDFHRLGTTAYALVLESLHEHPVDIGCVVYGRIEGNRLLVERDLHVIDDELRQWFIDERDERMRMVTDEIDPGKPQECEKDCPYLGECGRG